MSKFGYGEIDPDFCSNVWHRIVLMAYTRQPNPAKKVKILIRYQHIISKYLPHTTGTILENSTELLRFPITGGV